MNIPMLYLGGNCMIVNKMTWLKNLCHIFSGNSIYYPNNEESFTHNIIEKNRFEWFGHRFPDSAKHIFLRDIHKQWYLSGINSKINTPERLFEFLKKETEGYEVICVGSSAGEYAAILYGSLLEAKQVYAFSPQLELNSMLSYSSEEIDPLIFRLKDSYIRKYYDLNSFMNESTEYYYFCPIKAKWDKLEYEYALQNNFFEKKNFQPIFFNTSTHGVPFPKVALDSIFSNPGVVKKYIGKKNNPIFFSMQLCGVYKTVKGCYLQLKNHFLQK